MGDVWPHEALRRRAGYIGNAVLDLLAQQPLWIHRRLERIEILSATQFKRTVAADLTVPVALVDDLELRADPTKPGTGDKRCLVIPLASLPKGALVDFTLTPADANRLTARATNVVLLSALAPYVRQSGVQDRRALLTLAQRIILSETERTADVTEALAMLDGATGGNPAARDVARKILIEFNSNFALLISIDVVAGLPLTVTYGHRDYYPPVKGSPYDAPLVIDAPLVHASGPGPAYRLELVAPDGLEIETASLARMEGAQRVAIEAVNAKPGAGAFVQLRAPDSGKRPAQTALVAELGWVRGGIHQLAAVAGSLSTGSLLLATVLSFAIGTDLGGSSASSLFAAPALVTSLVLGFATTRITSAAANRLRLAALWIALLGIVGALLVSVLAGKQANLHALRGLLVAATVFSALILGAWPLPAALRDRSRVELAGASQ
jgi:hypothetical protein